MAIDSHMHVNDYYGGSTKMSIENVTRCSYIEKVINVGIDINTSIQTLNIAKKNNKFFSAVGIHPLYVGNQDFNELYKLANHDKVVAIGEIGLDNTKPNYYLQKLYLVKQIIIANDLGLPVIIHSNNCNEEIIDIFKYCIKPEFGCVFHCFQPDMKILNYLIENNYYISFAGKITYKNAKKSIEVAKNVPNNLFLVETDSPYIAVEPHKNLISECSDLRYIIEKLAEVKNLNCQEIESLTVNNTKRLFKRMII